MPNLRQWPAPLTLRRIVIIAFSATFVLFLLFQWHDHPLSPYSIVSLELAWTPATAGTILAQWGAGGQQVARQSLWLDFLFMPAYAFLFAGATLSVARGAPQGFGAGTRINWQRWGFWLAALPFVAWACDITENLALLRVLAAADTPSATALQVAGWAASTKFELLLVCLAYSLGVLLLNRR